MLTSCGGFGPVRRSISSISTVAPEKTVAATWVSGSLTFRPHEHASRFHVLEHAPQRGRCRKGRAGPERHLAERLHPQPRRGRPAASSRSQLRILRVVGAPSLPCCGASACRLMPSASASLLFLLLRLWLSIGLCALTIAAFLFALDLPFAPFVWSCPLLFINK